MEKNTEVKIYINSSKAYYYPGEQFLASILLDVQQTVNTEKMTIIAKGKQIVKATHKKIVYETDENVDDSEEEENEEEEELNKNQGEITEINETKIIFKYEKNIRISKNNYLKPGKYSFPLEVQLPKNIPGSFLFLESKTYAEIIYSIKVKLNNINVKERAPIIIRQNEEMFNYLAENQYSKIKNGCCCQVNETTIKLKANEKFTLSGEDIKLNVNINNTKSGNTSSPITIEVYQKLVLKNKNKKIKITKIVGKYKGNKIINEKENYFKNIELKLDINNYISSHLDKTKSSKYFKHKRILPLLNQSIKSDLINNEYEVYAESQLSNLTADELGVFLSVLIYPPEKGILSKTISNISKEFSESIINNKKIFLDNETNDIESELENSRKKNYKNKNKDDYLDTQSVRSEKSVKSEKSEKSLKSEKSEKNSQKKNIKDKNKDNEFNEKKSNNSLNKVENLTNKEINENEIKDIQNLDNNKIINNENNDKDKSLKKSNIMSDEISFGTSTKDKLYLFNAETTSNNFKKNFNQNFLNDALDDQFLDTETMK